MKEKTQRSIRAEIGRLPDAYAWRYRSAMSKAAPHQPAWHGIITNEPGKRGGRPVIRGTRIPVSDVLGWLASGMSEAEIIADFPELTIQDIRAALAFAAAREHGTVIAVP